MAHKRKRKSPAGTRSPAHDSVTYDDKDEVIMKNLMTDARRSARQIAASMGLSTVTVLSRIRRLEEAGFIKGYHASIDHEKIGYGLTALIEIVARKDKIIEIEDVISGYDNVCAAYDMTGASDMMVVARFRSGQELSEFVKGLGAIPHVENTITHVVLNTAKEDFRLI